jgi:hypothetical protein
VAGRTACRKLLAICGSSQEFWHVAASAWQNPPGGYRDPKVGRVRASELLGANTATHSSASATEWRSSGKRERAYRNSSQAAVSASLTRRSSAGHGGDRPSRTSRDDAPRGRERSAGRPAPRLVDRGRARGGPLPWCVGNLCGASRPRAGRVRRGGLRGLGDRGRARRTSRSRGTGAVRRGFSQRITRARPAGRCTRRGGANGARASDVLGPRGGPTRSLRRNPPCLMRLCCVL